MECFQELAFIESFSLLNLFCIGEYHVVIQTDMQSQPILCSFRCNHRGGLTIQGIAKNLLHSTLALGNGFTSPSHFNT